MNQTVSLSRVRITRAQGGEGILRPSMRINLKVTLQLKMLGGIIEKKPHLFHR